MKKTKKKKKTSISKTESPSVSPLDSRIVPVGEMSDWLSIAVYGRSGTGKTTFAGTAPKPLLILDVNDRGTISVKDQPETYVLSIEKWEDFEEVYWYLKSGNHNFQSVAMDTLTQLQDLAIRQVVGGESSGTVISQRAWGAVSALMKTWILNFRDLPSYKILICQDRITISDDENATDSEMIAPEVGPALSPSVARTLNAAVDVIGQTFIRERRATVKTKKGGEKSKVVVEYCMRIGPHARYLTKIRRAKPGTKLPPLVVDPTFDKILKLVKGEEDFNYDEE